MPASSRRLRKVKKLTNIIFSQGSNMERTKVASIQTLHCHRYLLNPDFDGDCVQLKSGLGDTFPDRDDAFL